MFGSVRDMSLCYAQNTRAGGVGTRKVNLIALRRDVPSSVDGRDSARGCCMGKCCTA